jgi:hypothetical protein
MSGDSLIELLWRLFAPGRRTGLVTRALAAFLFMTLVTPAELRNAQRAAAAASAQAQRALRAYTRKAFPSPTPHPASTPRHKPERRP